MNQNGPIIVIEDDFDDQQILSAVFKTLAYSNEIIFFSDGPLALEYLTTSKDKPFLILSDINLPKLTGLELRDKLHNNAALKLKCIPYLFFSTSGNQKDIIEAYSTSAQGFFVKPSSHQHIERIIKIIVEYWRECEAPDMSYD